MTMPLKLWRAAWPTADHVFWMDRYIARTTYIEELAQRIERLGWYVEVDQGWSPWDLRAESCPFWRFDIKSVTEYPGGKDKFIFRFRASFRLSRIGWATLAAAAAFLAYSPMRHAGAFVIALLYLYAQGQRLLLARLFSKGAHKYAMIRLPVRKSFFSSSKPAAARIG